MSGRFLSGEYLEAIRRRAGAGEQPWADAHARLVAAAEEALQQAPLSVRQNGGSPFFRQDAVYVPGKDGVVNPEANRKSGELAGQLSRCSLTLALAWRLTGEPRYADKALQLIHAWCINQNTYMNPTGRMVDSWTRGAEFGGDIILFGCFPGLFQAAYLLADYAGWDLCARAAVKRWVRAMIDPQRSRMFYEGREMYNNWDDARLLYLAKGALFLDDLDLLIEVFDRWRLILPLKMTDEGELPRETMRTRSMHYTLFALHSMTEVAEIARQFGEDLYDCEVNGRGLKKAVDYAARYLLHMDQWPFQMIQPLADDRGGVNHMGLFEMAAARWGPHPYLDVIAVWGGRPVTAGHATLLFAAV